MRHFKKSWADIGAKAFEKEQKEGEPMSVVFPKEPERQTKEKLRSFGFKWNRVRREWEGFSKIEELKKTLENSEATIRKIEN